MTGGTPAHLDVAGSVPLAVLERSGMTESVHLGAAVLVAPDGAVLAGHGDIAAPVYPRSTLKFVQATAALATGIRLSPVETVLAAASHTGTAAHQEVVAGMLDAAGLGEDDLGCPPDWPGDRDALRAATAPRRLAMNCSGKHAAFLAACVHAGWSTGDYLEPDHPLQARIRDAVEEAAGEPIAHSGVDGCGAPVHAVTLTGLARATGRVLGPGSALAAAVRAHPWALDGPGGANTTVIERTGLVAKRGAEGVLVLATADGAAVAVKVLDGSSRATTAVGLALLAGAGLLDAEIAAAVSAEVTETVLGAGVPVGAIRSLV